MSVFRPKLLSSVVLLALSAPTLAAGFHVTTHSATGLGRANAGEGVIADNASVLARNPAAMTLFDSMALSGGFTNVAPTTSVSDGTLSLGDTPVGTLPAQEDLAGVKNIPNIFFIMPVTPDLSFGLAAFSNFGTGTEFSTEYNKPLDPNTGLGGNLFGGLTEISTINLNTSVAYRFNEQLSLGFGIDVIQGEGKVERPLALEYAGDGIATGWDAGVMYELNAANRWSLTYRSGVELEAEGKGTVAVPSVGVFDLDNLNIKLPEVAEFSGFHQLSDAFALHYSAQYIGWGAFDNLTFSGELVGEQPVPYNWDDSWRFAAGTTYGLTSNLTLRAGVALDQTPVPETSRKIAIIDSDRIWYSAGATYAFNDSMNVDFGFTYMQGEEVEVVDVLSNGVTNTSTTDLSAIITGVQFSMTF